MRFLARIHPPADRVGGGSNTSDWYAKTNGWKASGCFKATFAWPAGCGAYRAYKVCPTDAPTLAPSDVPTYAPTGPQPAPATTSPSAFTYSPSTVPTTAPTGSRNPTTSIPSGTPLRPPTARPTGPSVSPTKGPTTKRTNRPTYFPTTIGPTNAPQQAPKLDHRAQEYPPSIPMPKRGPSPIKPSRF